MCFLLGIWEYSKFISCLCSTKILCLPAGMESVVVQRFIDTVVDEVVLPLWVVM